MILNDVPLDLTGRIIGNGKVPASQAGRIVMEYLKVLWKHCHADEPVWLYYEINNERWETRKVEVFRDGSSGYADSFEARGGSRLSIEPFRATMIEVLAEIAEDPQFEPSVIGKDEFEKVWSGREENVRHDDTDSSCPVIE